MVLKTILAGIVLTAIAIVSVVLSVSNQNVILSRLTIERLVKENSSGWELVCDESHGPRVKTQSLGSEDSFTHQSEVITCRKTSDTLSFDEAGFLNALKTAIEKEITVRGGMIDHHQGPQTSGFSFEYTAGKTHGNLEIAGRNAGTDYYNLEATVDEKKTR